MMKRFIAGILLLATGAACTNNKTAEVTDSSATPVKTVPADSLTYTYDSVRVYSKTPVSTNKAITDTAKAVVIYPVFKDAATNKFLEEKVIALAGKKDVYKTYKQLATGFITEFDTYKTGNPIATDTWFTKMDLGVKANYANYISVLFIYQDYKGGAHPNYLFTYFNYNPKTFQTITLDSLITADGMPKLRSVAENIFRKNEQLAPNASLSDRYFFADGVFSLPETFTLTQEGIKFLYNPYEIKAYAEGITELVVPFSKINDIMKESSILVNFK